MSERIVIESRLLWPICAECQIVLKTRHHLGRHLRETHHISILSAKKTSEATFAKISTSVTPAITALRQEYESATDLKNSDRPHPSLPAVGHLKTYVGLQCTFCFFCTITDRSMREHLKKSHKYDSTEELSRNVLQSRQNGNVTLQSLCSGNQKRVYFRVMPRTIASAESNVAISANLIVQTVDENDCSGSSGSDDLQRFSSITYPKALSSFETSGMEENERVMNALNVRLGTSRLLESLGLSLREGAYIGGSISGRTEEEKKLVALVETYLVQSPACIASTAPALLKRLFPKEGRSLQAVSRKTVRKYSERLARVVIAAYRMQKKGLCNSSTELVLNEYHNHCMQESDTDSLLLALHAIFADIFLTRLSINADVSDLLVTKLIACLCVAADYTGSACLFRFMEAEEVSPFLAALQNCILATAVIDLCKQRTRLIRGPKSVSQDTERYVKEEKERDAIIAAVDVESNTPLSYVRHGLDVCMAMYKLRDLDMSFAVCTEHVHCGFENGVELSMREQGAFISAWQSEIQQIMKKEFLFGGNFPNDCESVLQSLKDKPAERKHGYSILNHESTEGITRRWMLWALNEMSRCGRGAHQMFASKDIGSESYSPVQMRDTMPSGEFRVYRNASERFLRSAHRVQELLILCIHLSYGSPARATEIETLRLQNGIHGQRNVYISRGDIGLLFRYSKTRGLQGSDKHILRIPDTSTAYLLKLYLVMFRPVEAKLVGMLHGDDRQRSHMEWLLVNRGARFSATEIRRIIGEGLRSKGKEMGMAGYRHYSAAMFHSIAKTFPSINENFISDLEAVGHMQAGHSVEIADKVYARTIDDFNGIGTTEVERYRTWCKAYNRALFDHHSELAKKGGKSRATSGIPVYYANACEKVLNELAASIPLLKELRSSLGSAELCKSQISRKRTATEALGCPNENSFLSIGEPCNANEAPTGLPLNEHRNSERDAALLLPALRRMLRMPSAMFRSCTQADVTAEILRGSRDLLVIMATGSGKTICVLLPVFIEGKEKTTIIIVPLVALEEEILLRCKAYGISAASWKNRNARDVQVLVFAVEHVDSENYRGFVRSLCSRGRLRRIVVDEAHITVLWDDFRPALQKLQFLIHSIDGSVQRVLLSATLQPSDRSIAIMAHGLRSAYIYLDATVRKNLYFSVINCNGNAGIGDGRNSMEHALSTSLENNITLFHEEGVLGPGKPCIRVLIFITRKRDRKGIHDALLPVLKPISSSCLLHYDADLSHSERAERSEMWKKSKAGSICIMICTSAFGTGVDCNNVKLVYHFGTCSSLSEYAQQAGRAGRDGNKASCFTLYHEKYMTAYSKLLHQQIAHADSAREKVHAEMRASRFQEFRSWVENNSHCRKNMLYSKLDGRNVGICLHDESSENCDICHAINVSSNVSRSPIVNQIAASNGCLTPQDDATRINTEAVMQLLGPLQPKKGNYRMVNEASNILIMQKQDRQISMSIALSGFPKVSIRTAAEAETSFFAIVSRMKGLCVGCLANHSKETLSDTAVDFCDSCREILQGCFRCISRNHQVGACPLPIYVHRFCSNCALDTVNGKSVHINGNGFGRKCTLPALRRFFWLLWWNEKWRDGILEEVCTANERKMILQDRPLGGDFKSRMIAVNNWVHTGNLRNPVILRVLCWWVTKQFDTSS